MNNTELILLSLVAEAPRYGSEIERAIETRGLRRWISVGYASVYYVLNKLEKENLVRGELPPDDPRATQKRYEATPAGQAVLKTQVIDRIARSKGGLGEFELGVLCANALPPMMIEQALEQRQAHLKRQIEQNRKALDACKSDGGLNLQAALYERAITLLSHDLAWLEDFTAAWAEVHSAPGEQSPMPSHTDSDEDITDKPPSPKQMQKFRRPPLE